MVIFSILGIILASNQRPDEVEGARVVDRGGRIVLLSPNDQWMLNGDQVYRRCHYPGDPEYQLPYGYPSHHHSFGGSNQGYLGQSQHHYQHSEPRPFYRYNQEHRYPIIHVNAPNPQAAMPQEPHFQTAPPAPAQPVENQYYNPLGTFVGLVDHETSAKIIKGQTPEEERKTMSSQQKDQGSKDKDKDKDKDKSKDKDKDKSKDKSKSKDDEENGVVSITIFTALSAGILAVLVI